MGDQAEGLRKLLRKNRSKAFETPAAKTGGVISGIAIASGKGGVGKTNAVANIAYAIQQMGKKALVFDADMGLGNVHILLGLAPRYNIQHVMDGQRKMEEIIIKGPGGIDILPAGSGHRSYSELNRDEMLTLKTELEALEDKYDVILFDIGAGISANVMYFCSAASDIVVITTSEPTAFADAYALMNVLSKEYNQTDFKLIVNSVKSAKEASNVHNRLQQVAERFNANYRIELLGHIHDDELVPQAVRQQNLFLERYPGCKASKCIKAIATTILQSMKTPTSGIEWRKVFSA